MRLYYISVQGIPKAAQTRRPLIGGLDLRVLEAPSLAGSQSAGTGQTAFLRGRTRLVGGGGVTSGGYGGVGRRWRMMPSAGPWRHGASAPHQGRSACCVCLAGFQPDWYDHKHDWLTCIPYSSSFNHHERKHMQDLKFSVHGRVQVTGGTISF